MLKKEFKEFKELIREASKDLTREEISDKTRLPLGHVNRLWGNANIEQPSMNTVGKIIRAFPLLDGDKLLEATGYSSDDTFYSSLLIPFEPDESEEIGIYIKNKIEEGFGCFIKEKFQWTNKDELMSEFLYRYGFGLDMISSEKGMRENHFDPKNGVYAFRATFRWSYSLDLEKRNNCGIYVVFRCDKLENGKYVLREVSFDALSLVKLGDFPIAIINNTIGEDCDLTKIDTIIFEEEEELEDDSIEKHIFEALKTADLSCEKHKVTTFGLGIPIDLKKLPKNAAFYILDNRNYLDDDPSDYEIVNNLIDFYNEYEGRIPNELLFRIFEDYVGEEVENIDGIFAAILTIVNKKAKEKTSHGLYNFEVDICTCSEEAFVKPCIYVDEMYYHTYGKCNKDIKWAIEEFLDEEFKKLLYPESGTVLVSKVVFKESDSVLNFEKKEECPNKDEPNCDMNCDGCWHNTYF